MIKKTSNYIINHILRKVIWLAYYIFYLRPLDYYFYIKLFLGLSKEIEYQGSSNFSDKICIFVSYPVAGKISKNLKQYLLDLHQLGYSIIFISNKYVVSEDIEDLKSICVRIVVRENYGKDFGAYKFGIMKYKNQIMNSKSLTIANDSVIQIVSLRTMFNVMNSKNFDFWGISEAYHGGMYKNHHICSYFLVISQKIIKSEVFWSFWKNYKPVNSRVNIIQYGEINFSLTMKNHGFNMNTYINSSTIYKILKQNRNNLVTLINHSVASHFIKSYKLESALWLLYTQNHNVCFIKAMIQLGLPVIKKDVFSRCHYYADELSEILQELTIFNRDEVVNELLSQVAPFDQLKDKVLKFIGEK